MEIRVLGWEPCLMGDRELVGEYQGQCPAHEGAQG